MGTRSGDIDPAIPLYMQSHGLTAGEVDRALNQDSGLIGLSTCSNDMRDLLIAAASGHAKAQLAVDGDAGKYPEFKGNVAAVDARPFWRDKEVSPSGAGYHYNHNAETYMEVGNALGRAMAELLEGR